MPITRRKLGLGALGATLATLVAGAEPFSSRRFLFINVRGGWDPLCVFAPMFDAPNIDMEPGTQPLSIGNFNLVDSAARPAVPAFFQRWGDRTLLLNGVSTRSVNHETCLAVILTGSTNDSGADWPTIIAASELADHYLPHVVMSGPAFPGQHAIAVSHLQGLVQPAVFGDVLELGDEPFDAVAGPTKERVDAYLAERAKAFSAHHPLAEQHAVAMERSRALTDNAELLLLPPAFQLRGQAENAIRLLSDGVARCATVSTPFVWDTHANNDPQSPQFEELFGDLDHLLGLLDTTNGPSGSPLADDTVVVVLSEMGRTPAFNSTNGRDHWPYTSALMIGAGITGGRTIGGFTDLYAGIGVDAASGDLDTNAAGIDALSFGATLLQLAGLDPAAHMTASAPVISGVIA